MFRENFASLARILKSYHDHENFMFLMIKVMFSLLAHFQDTCPQYPLFSGAGLDMINDHPESSDEDSTDQKPLIPGHLGEHEDYTGPGLGAGRGKPTGPPTPAGGKKTKGRVKIKMEFIDNKLRRYTTFSKRKTGIMKKVRADEHLFWLRQELKESQCLSVHLSFRR